MAQLQITLTPDGSTIRTTDSTSNVPTPNGLVAAGSLQVGDTIYLFSDNTHPVEIYQIEEVV
jgi:hypothetical protein